MVNIAVAQSGGPTSVINASLLGVFRAAVNSGKIDHVYGSFNGIEGILGNRLLDLTRVLNNERNCQLLRQTPGAALGSCRHKLPDPDKDPKLYEQIAACFAEYDIRAFFYIGGNDSMDTTAKLSAYFRSINSPIRVIGVPKTIDNDLMYTDHTPGFGSAARYLTVTMQELIRDCNAYNLQSVTVVEIMGRSAGWLTAACCLLRDTGEKAPQLIYLPEAKLTLKQLIEDVRNALHTAKTVVLAVSEGVTFSDLANSDTYMSGATDVFGHKYLSGIGKYLENQIKKQIGCKVRSVELNIMQRCSAHLASQTDLEEAESIGAAAVQAALNGETGRVMVFRRISDVPYRVEIESVDASLIANGERTFPAEWITAEQNQIRDEAMAYFRPLITDEPKILVRNGIPEVIRLQEYTV